MTLSKPTQGFRERRRPVAEVRPSKQIGAGVVVGGRRRGKRHEKIEGNSEQGGKEDGRGAIPNKLIQRGRRKEEGESVEKAGSSRIF